MVLSSGSCTWMLVQRTIHCSKLSNCEHMYEQNAHKLLLDEEHVLSMALVSSFGSPFTNHLSCLPVGDS